MSGRLRRERSSNTVVFLKGLHHEMNLFYYVKHLFTIIRTFFWAEKLLSQQKIFKLTVNYSAYPQPEQRLTNLIVTFWNNLAHLSCLSWSSPVLSLALNYSPRQSCGENVKLVRGIVGILPEYQVFYIYSTLRIYKCWNIQRISQNFSLFSAPTKISKEIFLLKKIKVFLF